MITVSHVSMRFGSKVLFEDVTTTFSAGRRYGLTGPNGAGKSTFMKLLTGDLMPRGNYHTAAKESLPIVNPNPTLFEPREASEPYSRGQWDSALKATPHSPKGDVSYVGALEPTACSGAHGFRSRRPRSLLTGAQLLSD